MTRFLTEDSLGAEGASLQQAVCMNDCVISTEEGASDRPCYFLRPLLLHSPGGVVTWRKSALQ